MSPVQPQDGCAVLGSLLASGQPVAVKLLFARFEEMMMRFHHELLEAIAHPGIVRVRDFDLSRQTRMLRRLPGCSTRAGGLDPLKMFLEQAPF